MTNNDILRRIRYTFDFSDAQMLSLFELADHRVTREQVCNWLKKDGDPAQVQCSDRELAQFLNGLIISKRGKKDGAPPQAEQRMTNNIILLKLKIALNLKAEDISALMDLAGFHLSKPELSAFFRRAQHPHFRACQDQILRNFLKGLQLRYRPNSAPKTPPPPA